MSATRTPFADINLGRFLAMGDLASAEVAIRKGGADVHKAFEDATNLGDWYFLIAYTKSLTKIECLKLYVMTLIQDYYGEKFSKMLRVSKNNVASEQEVETSAKYISKIAKATVEGSKFFSEEISKESYWTQFKVMLGTRSLNAIWQERANTDYVKILTEASEMNRKLSEKSQEIVKFGPEAKEIEMKEMPSVTSTAMVASQLSVPVPGGAAVTYDSSEAMSSSSSSAVASASSSASSSAVSSAATSASQSWSSIFYSKLFGGTPEPVAEAKPGNSPAP